MDRTQPVGVIESEQYATTRTRLTQDPVVRAMAAELYAGIRAGKVTSASLFHDDGSPRFELMQRTNAEYVARGGESNEARHIGAIAEAIVLVWNETPEPEPQQLHMLLAEKANGEWVAVGFPSHDTARDFQDQIEATDLNVTFRGVVPVVNASEALK